ncbi:MAG: hypothetical protein MZV63_43560 [Marinilabiliales bacterium]|nr:hypothetical protein [Marinilabiliales bacterium]
MATTGWEIFPLMRKRPFFTSNAWSYLTPFVAYAIWMESIPSVILLISPLIVEGFKILCPDCQSEKQEKKCVGVYFII